MKNLLFSTLAAAGALTATAIAPYQSSSQCFVLYGDGSTNTQCGGDVSTTV